MSPTRAFKIFILETMPASMVAADIWISLCRKKESKKNLLTGIHFLEFLPQFSWSETVLIKSIIPINTIKDLQISPYKPVPLLHNHLRKERKVLVRIIYQLLLSIQIIAMGTHLYQGTRSRLILFDSRKSSLSVKKIFKNLLEHSPDTLYHDVGEMPKSSVGTRLSFKIEIIYRNANSQYS